MRGGSRRSLCVPVTGSPFTSKIRCCEAGQGLTVSHTLWGHSWFPTQPGAQGVGADRPSPLQEDPRPSPHRRPFCVPPCTSTGRRAHCLLLGVSAEKSPESLAYSLSSVTARRGLSSAFICDSFITVCFGQGLSVLR